MVGTEDIHLVSCLDAFGKSPEAKIPAQLDEVLMWASDSGESEMALVNDLSILRESTGNCCR